ncbi:L-Aspartase-like protein [Podospora didyma]|uniref:L-Aspartase-like protein n=1 Tax=Podospora didyma TaxID=330526 RepID=A0AAE0NQY0_9PEZI|nr:L-Aspartase-like protein [Podospora didyma]
MKYTGITVRTPHAAAVHAEWRALRRKLASDKAVTLTGNDLSIADTVAVSCYGVKCSLTDNEDILHRIAESVDFLRRELEAGHVVYGVNTGFGGSADTRSDDHERLQSALIQHQNSGILTSADMGGQSSTSRNGSAAARLGGSSQLLRSHALPIPIVRGAMLVRCNSLMRGHSGVRLCVVETIAQLLSRDMTPVIPLRGSISASGDLMPLSYLAGAIEGNPGIYINSSSSSSKKPRTYPAHEALYLVGLEPVRLQAKEGLGITNGTAPSCAAAAIVVHQTNQLAVLVQLLTAMGTEALLGSAHNYHPFIAAVRPHGGQVEAAANILAFLSGSKLSPTTDDDSPAEKNGLAQDRYGLRTASQWIGPQLEDLALATRQVSTELNSTTDNPLIDASAGRVHHGGNFQATSITSAMEKTLLVLQSLGRLLFSQSAELINNQTNKGLPPNLTTDEPSTSFTAKGFDINMAAYLAELGYLAHPVSPHMQTAEMANQSLNSMALVAARYALEAVEVLSLMAAAYIYTLCQALDLRCLQLEFRAAVPGVLLPIIWECLPPLTATNSDATAVYSELADKAAAAVLERWDKFSHKDTRERSRTAVQESLGSLILELSKMNIGTEGVVKFHELASTALEMKYQALRAIFLDEKQTKTREYISPASRVVYDFVRDELRVPLNRGVADHPPLLLRRVQENGDLTENGNKSEEIVAAEEDLALRGRTLGAMASGIYEAVRSGQLHNRIMRFGEGAKLWGGHQALGFDQYE